ncbi:MAG: HlyD family efflux transporter periplasmic adaptor subunit [Massilibacteroides sp.]|nr:HlyD family efflux transporter periplasmic adaptor subunit [Massilibacteroides sp.]MDD4114570.1 HlyD family efflux transporter periplasmic adaptor subunit [Massilibacteroides sp.]MDD4659138.1 HlyD family efflux transporter periplasmic adaptor subunit [Massilibacteroides sp.]
MNKWIYTVCVAVSLLCSCGDNEEDYDAMGAFEATEVIVSSEVAGKILWLNILEGDRLKAGQEVGCVDSLQLYYKKEQLRAGLRAVDVAKPDIRKQIAVLEQQITTVESERQRMENLVKAKAGNQKSLDDLVNQLGYLRKQLDAQYSSLSKTTGRADAEAEGLVFQVMQLDDMIAKCRVINPLTGTVLIKYAEAGEVTAAGKPLYKIADTDLLFLRAYITADQLSLIKKGQSVSVYSDFGKNEQREYIGTVAWIADQSEFTPKGIQSKNERTNLVYAVKVAVKNDGYLKIGQYGELKF